MDGPEEVPEDLDSDWTKDRMLVVLAAVDFADFLSTDGTFVTLAFGGVAILLVEVAGSATLILAVDFDNDLMDTGIEDFLDMDLGDRASDDFPKVDGGDGSLVCDVWDTDL